MTLYARIENGAVVETFEHSSDPTPLFDPSWTWVACPAGTQCHATYDGKTFVNPASQPAPPVVEPEQQYLTTPSRPQFLMLFTSAERVAIRASSDPVIKDWLAIVEDPALTEIDLSLASVQEGLAYLVTAGLLTEARRAVIAKGWPQ